jgi:TetR/AcrR family transcriptional regulator
LENQLLLDHENAERILEEGWRLFQLKGYRGVTIDDLCTRCRLSKPTLYYYFKDKENLFVNVLQHRLSGFHAAADRSGPLSERLSSVAEAILDSFQTEYSTILRDREHIRKPENLKKIREAFHRELFEPLNAIMQAGIDQGKLKADSSDTLTLVFLGIINNFIGKAADMAITNSALAQKLTVYFLEGAAKPRASP